ncbi:hypothetical protein Chor_005572, partial [Crotalus horridus]
MGERPRGVQYCRRWLISALGRQNKIKPNAPSCDTLLLPEKSKKHRVVIPWSTHFKEEHKKVANLYVNNKIRTTKYRFWSFIPRNLFEQFHRVANLYFLFIVLLNWVPAVEAFRKEITMIPLCVAYEINPEDIICRIECETPNNDLTSFRGFINTEAVVGIVVYAGHETKAMLNTTGARYKRSKLEKRMNKDILWCVLLLIVMCFIGAIGHRRWLSASKRPPLYASGKEVPIELGGFLMFWTMIILLQLGQIFLIRNDLDLYDESSDRKIQCGSLNIAEDLGQIEYIFSDKTGTLTENKMVFRRCSIAGLEYGHEENEEDDEAAYFSSHSSLRHAARPRFFSHRSSEFLNSRILQKTSSMGLGSWRHLAFSSPLRRWSSMVKMPALNLGEFKNIFQRLSSRRMSLQSPDSSGGQKESAKNPEKLSVHVKFPSSPAQILDTLEMPAGSPSPKKSDILRLPEDRPDRLSYESLNIPEICYEAESPDEAALVHAARAYQCTLKARSPEQVQIDFASLGMLTFQLLHLLPFDSVRKRATGIEDRLQEGVPETIAALRKAGINIWMLTGDKKETAINIAYSCKLLDGSDKLFTLDSENLVRLQLWWKNLFPPYKCYIFSFFSFPNQETCALKAKSILEEIGIRTGTPKPGNTPGTAASAMSFALIINGPTLDFALNKRVKDTFMQLARKVRAVICCRATPLQKSKMVKEAQKELQVMTLAV